MLCQNRRERHATKTNRTERIRCFSIHRHSSSFAALLDDLAGRRCRSRTLGITHNAWQYGHGSNEHSKRIFLDISSKFCISHSNELQTYMRDTECGERTCLENINRPSYTKTHVVAKRTFFVRTSFSSKLIWERMAITESPSLEAKVHIIK